MPGSAVAFGSRTRHPYLNIVLPGEFESRDRHTKRQRRSAARSRQISLANAGAAGVSFTKRFLCHRRAFSSTARTFTCLWNIARRNFTFQLFIRTLHRQDGDRVRVANGTEVVAFKTVQASPRYGLSTVRIRVQQRRSGARYEFRIYVGGGRAEPAAVYVFGAGAGRGTARRTFLPAELHIASSCRCLLN